MPDTSLRPAGQRQSRPALRTYGAFAGVGGFELGFARAGLLPSGFCEIDPAARAVLNARFADVPIDSDIVKVRRLPAGVNLLAGGFPCQDLSQMGEQRGLAGRRSGLVREIFRLMRTSGPELVLLENVRFMLHQQGGQTMRTILTEIEALGYSWAYRVVDTRAFGLPQRRERVLLLASRGRDPRPALLGCDAGESPPSPDSAQAFGFYWTEGSRGVGWVPDGVPTLKGISGFGIPSPPAVVLSDKAIVVPGIGDAERLQGFPRGWTAPANQVDKHRGTRWRLVNNAVSVPVATWIARRLQKPDDDFVEKGVPLRDVDRFPRAAWNVGDGRFASAVSAWPVRYWYRSIETILLEHSLLSARAARGFHRRLTASGLRTPQWFIGALVDHIDRMS